MRSQVWRSAVVVGVVASGLVAGCGSSQEEEPAATGAAPTSQAPAVAEPETAEPEETTAAPDAGLHGIVVVSGAGAAAPSLQAYDPGSGAPGGAVAFTPAEQGVGYDSWYARMNGGWSWVMRAAFSPDFTKLVAAKANAGGEGNTSTLAGYLDTSGLFTDMSSLAGGSGDFAAVTDSMSAFDDDGAFWFARRPQSDSLGAAGVESLYRVDEGATSAQTVDFPGGEDDPNEGFTLTAKGPQARGPVSPLWGWTTDGKRGCWSANDISPKWCLTVDDTELNLVPTAKYHDFELYPEREGWRELLPESNNREVASPVFSPDGSQVAFMAKSSTGEESWDLFVVDTAGGDPTKVEGVSLDSGDQLLEWVE